MKEKYALVLLAFAISVSVAGCTVSQASDRDQYGSYLSELNSGNADFNNARGLYNTGMNAFKGGMYYDAINAMSSSYDNYNSAMMHYDQMTGYAAGPDQQAYAGALKSYAQSCMFAASAYSDAYKAYEGGDHYKGDTLMSSAAGFVKQANEYHDKAVELQAMAII
jgi:tetratricopeptide (TPR) repeat protein